MREVYKDNLKKIELFLSKKKAKEKTKEEEPKKVDKKEKTK
jgi:hypothetical protein